MASAEVVALPSTPRKEFSVNGVPSSPLPTIGEMMQNWKQELKWHSPTPNLNYDVVNKTVALTTPPRNNGSQIERIRSFQTGSADSASSLDGLRVSLKAIVGKSSPQSGVLVGRVTKPRKPATKAKNTAEGGGEGAESKKPNEPKGPKKAAKHRAKKSEDEASHAMKEPSTTEPKKPRNPRAKKDNGSEANTGERSKKTAAPRKPRPKKTDKEGSVADPETTVKPTRKPRAKKINQESQIKLPLGKVTKSGTTPKAGKKDDKKVSKISTVSKGHSDVVLEPLESGLAKAIGRRVAWTPPKVSSKSPKISPAGSDYFESMSNCGLAQREKKGWGDLLGSFGFTKTETTVGEKAFLGGEVTRKRKLIELVKSTVPTDSIQKEKVKAPRKKAKTLTDQATSPYAELAEEPAPPLLQYFAYQTTERVTKDGFKVPTKPRSKSPVKGAKKPKRGSAAAPILLSPESAMKKAVGQEFVFGTSSQLAREDSPTLLRDLHEAMQASNEITNDDLNDDSIFDLTMRSPVNKPQANRSLWSAACRDENGQLSDVMMIDLSISPALGISKIASAVTQPTATTPLKSGKDEWHEVDFTLSTATFAAASVEASTEDVWNEIEEAPTRLSDTSSDAIPRPIKVATRAELNSPNSKPQESPNKTLIRTQNSPSKKSPVRSRKSKTSVVTTKPDYYGYTTAQLAKEVSSYRFKPVKNRDQMILLLEKCWEGKQRIALGTLDTNTKIDEPVLPAAPNSLTPTKRGRGRPTKDSSASSPAKPKSPRSKITDTVAFLEMDSDTPLSQLRTPKRSQKKRTKTSAEEISDSEIRLTPSPPRRQASAIPTPPLTLSISTSEDSDASPQLSQASQEALLFKHIAKAITGATPSNDPSKPNWHEKILLYDPIVLEDLTVWLNTGALQKSGWDGEVDPKEAKKWCESKSICCLWRENLRGGSRSRY